MDNMECIIMLLTYLQMWMKFNIYEHFIHICKNINNIIVHSILCIAIILYIRAKIGGGETIHFLKLLFFTNLKWSYFYILYLALGIKAKLIFIDAMEIASCTYV
jgi:hypothetical protein